MITTAFYSADWMVVLIATAAAIGGMIIGVSGALAWLLATAVSCVAFRFCWGGYSALIAIFWVRVIVTAITLLLIFAAVRALVKKFIRVLVAQPGDAIFGAIISATVGFAFAVGALWLIAQTGFIDFKSYFLEAVAAFIG